jgi:uncharacterized protein (DUF2267 family)
MLYIDSITNHKAGRVQVNANLAGGPGAKRSKEKDMDYKEMIGRVRRLDFIKNEQKADAAVKAILGILAGRLNEEHARKITEKFGGRIIPNRAGNGQKRSETISFSEYIAEIRSQFNISVHQARVLVRNVLYFANEASGDGMLVEIGKSLPLDWSEAIRNA